MSSVEHDEIINNNLCTKYKEKPLLTEDEYAPDSLQYFDLDMLTKVGFSRLEMKAKGELVRNDDCIIYEYKGYELSICADFPFYQLFKL